MNKFHLFIASIFISNTALSANHDDYNQTIASPGLSIIFFDDNQNFSNEAIKAAKTILKNKECVGVTHEVDVSMYTGKSYANDFKIKTSQLQKDFNTKIPSIKSNTRFYFLTCKTNQSLLDNFYIRAEDIGSPEKVWRKNGKILNP